MEPKYLLMYDARNNAGLPYKIYEQMATHDVTENQGTELVSHKPAAIAKRLYATFSNLEDAMKCLSIINDFEPILLAYSSKPIDNVVNLSRD